MPDRDDWVPMNFRVTQQFFDDLEEMKQDMDAHSRVEVIRCALRLLNHTRQLLKRKGILLQEEDGKMLELIPDYINSRGRRISLSTREEIDMRLSDEDRCFLENMGIDPDEIA